MNSAAALDHSSLVTITEKAQAEIRTIFEREEKAGEIGLPPAFPTRWSSRSVVPTTR
jgi:hypothetical protein